jgi:hypothetical protein
MRPGVGWIIAGVALLGVGIAITMSSSGVIWYGAMIVGVIWIIRGIMRLSSAPPPDQHP